MGGAKHGLNGRLTDGSIAVTGFADGGKGGQEAVYHNYVAVSLGIVAAAWASPARSQAVVDFETQAPGTVYGALGGNHPGQRVLTQDGIDMFVENFLFASTPFFIQAEVGGPYGSYFPTTPLSMDNINVGFDFTGVGFDVEQVTVEFREFGGTSNFAVNGRPIIELPELDMLPSDIAPGVTAEVELGAIILTGDITEFIIGGQELAIDNIVAVPEPTALALLAVAAISARNRRRRAR